MFFTKYNYSNLILFLSFFILNSIFAQEEKSSSNLINQLTWLTGSYSAEKWESTAEEYWSLPLGNNMIGMFRLVKDGKIVSTELVYIIEENNSLVLRLKLFTPEFVGWDEKDKTIDFPLISIEENEVVFDGDLQKK